MNKGESVFYDVVDIQPANCTLEKQEPSTNVTTNKSPDAVHEGSPLTSICSSSGNVNSSSENHGDVSRNSDICCSSCDSEGDVLTEAQGKYFENSQV